MFYCYRVVRASVNDVVCATSYETASMDIFLDCKYILYFEFDVFLYSLIFPMWLSFSSYSQSEMFAFLALRDQ